jgi:hypothetical protein
VRPRDRRVDRDASHTDDRADRERGGASGSSLAVAHSSYAIIATGVSSERRPDLPLIESPAVVRVSSGGAEDVVETTKPAGVDQREASLRRSRSTTRM